jgi:hypothetical protein
MPRVSITAEKETDMNKNDFEAQNLQRVAEYIYCYRDDGTTELARARRALHLVFQVTREQAEGTIEHWQESAVMAEVLKRLGEK